MFALDDLTEVELDNYIEDCFGDTAEFKENKKKNSIMKKISKLILENEAIYRLLEDIKGYIATDKFESAAIVGTELLKKSTSSANKLRNVLSEIGFSEDEFRETVNILQLEGNVDDGILRIILPELLPDAVKQGEGSRYAEIKSLYANSFREFFRNGKFPIYESKAVIVFVNFYTSEQAMKDHDNFEVKQIIDVLSVYLMPDDNPKWCSNYMDSKIGEYDHSEIYVVPQSKFASFFQENFV